MSEKATRLVVVGTKKLPPKKNRKRKLPKILTTQEVKRAFALLDTKTYDGLRDRIALELMYRAGLRVGEVCKLELRDVDHEEGVVIIMDGKGGDGTAYFDPYWLVNSQYPTLQDAIVGYLELRRHHRGQRFMCHEDGRPLNARYLQRLCRRLKYEARIEARFTPHTLRHTFATELLKDGFSLREVQTALRHANVATTEVYTHVIDTQLQRKINRRSRGGEA